MAKKKEKKIDLNSLEPEEMMKYEIAEELGTSKETGRIGGMVTRRKRTGRHA